MDIPSLSTGLVIGILVSGVIALFIISRIIREKDRLQSRLDNEELTKEELAKNFSLTAQEVLDKNSERFLQLAHEKLKQAQNDSHHDLDKRQKSIAAMIDPIDKSLQTMAQKVENLGKAGAGLEGQLKNFAEDQKMLRQETQNLVQALRNPAARGRWGEMQLQRALEMIGMVEGTHYTQQQNVEAEGIRRQPDFIITLPGEMQIVIDVKTPIEPYWDAIDGADTEQEMQKASDHFRRKVRDHLKQLSSKTYWKHFDSPEFVVMFMPTEGLYSMAVSNDPSLIEEAAKNNIILASPTTVMGLLRVVMHGWQQQKMAEEARTVSELAMDLYGRISKFGDHMRRMGSGLGTAIGAYNDAVGSLERSVLPGARKFKDLHVQTGGKDITPLNEIEKTPRILESDELTSGKIETIEEKKKA